MSISFRGKKLSKIICYFYGVNDILVLFLCYIFNYLFLLSIFSWKMLFLVKKMFQESISTIKFVNFVTVALSLLLTQSPMISANLKC